METKTINNTRELCQEEMYNIYGGGDNEAVVYDIVFFSCITSPLYWGAKYAILCYEAIK